MNKTLSSVMFALALLIAGNATAQKVQLFEQSNFQGQVAELAPGSYDVHKTWPGGLENDHDLKSMKVPLGLAVIFYEHAGRGGDAQVYSHEDIAELKHPMVMSKVSAIEVLNEFPSLDDVKSLKGEVWTGDFHWNHDDTRGASFFTLKDLDTITYSYGGGSLKGDFPTQLGHGGGNSALPVAANFTLKDGNELRFEWVTRDILKAEFWTKGTKAGQRRNNPPTTRATFRRMVEERG